MTDQWETPLLDALRAYVERGTLGFHSPGHKQGCGTHPGFRRYLGKRVFAIDLTVLPDLDFLSRPTGPIRQAQALAARAYLAGHAWFLVDGTSGGIHAMIAATAGPGDRVLVPRHCHKSVLAGLMLAGAVPVWLAPEYDEHLGIPLQVRPQQVADALAAAPDIRAAVMINPTYYGCATDLPRVVAICHAAGVPVLVDEAHGGGLAFNDSLPPSAMQAGADLSASSTHKIAGSMTQRSLLLQQGNRVEPARVQEMFNFLQTTSPSFVLMASIDAAVHGPRLITDALYLAAEARAALGAIPGVECLGPEVQGYHSVLDWDPTKITIDVTGLGLTGFQVEGILGREYRISIEVSGERFILIPITMGDNRARVHRFVAAMADLAARYRRNGNGNGNGSGRRWAPIRVPPLPPVALAPREAVYGRRRRSVPLAQAAGLVSAESVMIYPPGIPLVNPGEVITPETVAHVLALQGSTGLLQGLADPAGEQIRVVDL